MYIRMLNELFMPVTCCLEHMFVSYICVYATNPTTTLENLSWFITMFVKIRNVKRIELDVLILIALTWISLLKNYIRLVLQLIRTPRFPVE